MLSGFSFFSFFILLNLHILYIHISILTYILRRITDAYVFLAYIARMKKYGQIFFKKYHRFIYIITCRESKIYIWSVVKFVYNIHYYFWNPCMYPLSTIFSVLLRFSFLILLIVHYTSSVLCFLNYKIKDNKKI